MFIKDILQSLASIEARLVKLDMGQNMLIRHLGDVSDKVSDISSAVKRPFLSPAQMTCEGEKGPYKAWTVSTTQMPSKDQAINV